MSSAAESEIGGIFVNCKEGTVIRTTLDEMDHPQPATPVAVDNTTAVGIANDTVKQSRSRAIDMRFYWVRDRINQGQFHVYWVLLTKTRQTTSPNIFLRLITETCDLTISTFLMLLTLSLSRPALVVCEGVLITLALLVLG
jgi:hypothetical protein